MTKTEKKKRLTLIIERLKEIYPTAECALHYGGDPWKLLVMGRLSAQCTDARVNIVCEELFKRFPDAMSMAEGDITEIEEIVKPCGLYRMKADSIREASRMLITDFGGQLPDTMEELLKFPGVGRKIANLLLGDIFGKEAIVCDTHCIRICGRLGMYPEKEKDPAKIEKILRELMDLKEGSDFCHRIVFFGREVCEARNPKCDGCPLSDLCLKYEREHGKN
ncbi:MAG: endonuclease III [Clostridia bacterium]|nr:endonuclease III [Clostridia bacterium]